MSPRPQPAVLAHVFPHSQPGWLVAVNCEQFCGGILGDANGSRPIQSCSGSYRGGVRIRAARAANDWKAEPLDLVYIFPQLGGFGSSANSKFYALTDLAEATAYMQDQLLGVRLMEIGSTVAGRLRQGTSLRELMNSSVDVQKLVSCMTLFKGLAESAEKSGQSESLRRLSEVANEILLAANAEGFPPCGSTLDRLRISCRVKG